MRRGSGRAIGVFLALAVLASGRAATAQEAAAPDAEAHAAPDAEARAGVDAVFRDLDRPGSPGCACGVVVDGTLAYARGYGHANLDYGLPLGPGSVFYMGSVSKQFTAAAVVLAARDGLLSLDDDVRRWVPEIPDYGTPITIRHLLHHTSGLRDYLTLWSLAGIDLDDVVSRERTLDLLSRQRALNFRPGTEYLYSNTGYLLLAEIVERATGTPFPAFTRERIFAPLGMEDTHFHDDRRHVVANRAVGYEPVPPASEGPSMEGAEESGVGAGFRMSHAWNYERVGAGGLYSTVADLAKWERNWREGTVGGPDLGRAMLERGVLASGAGGAGGDTLAYAFGLQVGEYRGLATVGHSGSLAGFRNYHLRFPEQRTAVIVLCNLATAEPAARARRVADVVLADYLGPPEAPEPAAAAPESRAEPSAPAVDSAALASYEGRYASDELGTEYVITGHEGALRVRGPAGGTPLLRPRGEDAFGSGLLAIRFRRGPDGSVAGFTLDAGRVRGIEFVRLSR